jgi:hypothetical protein
MNTRPCSATRGADQLGRCPANRTVPGEFEVFGAGQANNAVGVTGSPAGCRHGEFFQELLTANNASAPRRLAVDVTNATSGAPEAGAQVEPILPKELAGRAYLDGAAARRQKEADKAKLANPARRPTSRTCSTDTSTRKSMKRWTDPCKGSYPLR